MNLYVHLSYMAITLLFYRYEVSKIYYYAAQLVGSDAPCGGDSVLREWRMKKMESWE